MPPPTPHPHPAQLHDAFMFTLIVMLFSVISVALGVFLLGLKVALLFCCSREAPRIILNNVR